MPSLRDSFRRIAGIVISLIAAFFLGSSGIVYKFASQTTGLQATLVCSFFSYILFLPIWTSERKEKEENIVTIPKVVVLVLLFGLCQVTSTLSLYMGLDYLDSVGDVMALCGAFPIWSLLLSRIILKEKCSYLEISLQLPTIAGVVLVSRPSFLFGTTKEANISRRVIGTIVSLLAGFTLAAKLVVSKKIGKAASESIQILIASVMFFCLYPFVTVIKDEEFFIPCLRDIGISCLSGLFQALANNLTVYALRFEKPGPVALAYSMQLVFTCILDVTILKTTLYLTSPIGSTLIFLGTVIPLIIKIFRCRPCN